MIFARLAVAAALACCVHPARAGLLGRLSRGEPISLRKRVHVNTLITETGTMEIEWGGAFSTGGDFTFPSDIKYTPEGRYIFWGRTEFSASFDSLASTVQFDDRATSSIRDISSPTSRRNIASVRLCPLFAQVLFLPCNFRCAILTVYASAWQVHRTDSAGHRRLTWSGKSDRPSFSARRRGCSGQLPDARRRCGNCNRGNSRCRRPRHRG